MPVLCDGAGVTADKNGIFPLFLRKMTEKSFFHRFPNQNSVGKGVNACCSHTFVRLVDHQKMAL